MRTSMSTSILVILATVQLFVKASSVTSDEKLNQLNQDPADLQVDVSDDYISNDLQNGLIKATISKDPWLNQYSPETGTDRLRKIIAAFYLKRLNLNINPDNHVLVTLGAHEALNSAFQSLTTQGSEWIIIEPFWLKYPPMIELAHGVLRFTSLKLMNKSSKLNGNDYVLDREELKNLLNNKTVGILFNNPNNPSGKVYSRGDLKFIASLVKKYNLIVISDEVHEFVVYEPYFHISIASLPGMFNHTITIGSASKAFDVAGWRVGWAFGPTHLMEKLMYVHHYYVHSAPTPQQDAVAYMFENELRYYGKPGSYFYKNRKMSMTKRDFLVSSLEISGMSPVVPNGGYCMIVDVPELRLINEHRLPEIPLETYLNSTARVLGLPMAYFYGIEHEHLGKDSIRFCFQKSDKTLQKARDRMMRRKIVLKL